MLPCCQQRQQQQWQLELQQPCELGAMGQLQQQQSLQSWQLGCLTAPPQCVCRHHAAWSLLLLLGAAAAQAAVGLQGHQLVLLTWAAAWSAGGGAAAFAAAVRVLLAAAHLRRAAEVEAHTAGCRVSSRMGSAALEDAHSCSIPSHAATRTRLPTSIVNTMVAFTCHLLHAICCHLLPPAAHPHSPTTATGTAIAAARFTPPPPLLPAAAASSRCVCCAMHTSADVSRSTQSSSTKLQHARVMLSHCTAKPPEYTPGRTTVSGTSKLTSSIRKASGKERP